jgi:hypothetical protein
MILFNIISVFCMLSPPVLLCIAWGRFLQTNEAGAQPKWRRIVGALSLTAISSSLVICVVKFFGYRCDAGAGDWSCVIEWRSFAGIVLRLTPALLVLAILGARRTRILIVVSVIAIAFDCILIDMMA